MKQIVVYGSLKRGKYNNSIIKEGKFVRDTKVNGTMYSLGSYPALVEEGDNEYEAEVWEVTDSEYQYIRSMEIGAGYKEVETEDGVLYYANDMLAERCRDNYKQVEGNSW